MNMPKAVKLGKMERQTFSKINEVAEMPNLIQIQTESYDWFIKEGLREVFEDISPIKDYAGNLVLEFIDYSLTDAPKYEQEECKERDVTYAAPLKVKVRLVNKETGEVKEQEVFMGDFPLMTEKGTFIYNGAERVVVTQLVRSPGPYYSVVTDKSNNKLYSTTIIPNRGAWLEYVPFIRPMLSFDDQTEQDDRLRWGGRYGQAGSDAKACSNDLLWLEGSALTSINPC